MPVLLIGDGQQPGGLNKLKGDKFHSHWLYSLEFQYRKCKRSPEFLYYALGLGRLPIFT